jgi:TetR/AcrR family transcriptional regulator, ethionamide resistance regulator
MTSTRPSRHVPTVPVLEAPERVHRLSRRQQDNEVEVAVLEAIERLLRRGSLHELSVERILEEAKTSRATFYRYFSSKWSVVAAALERAVIELFEAAEQFLAAPADEDPVDVLRRAMLAVTKVYRRHRYVLRAAMQYWPSIPELRKLWLHFLDQQINALTEFIEGQRQIGRAVAGPPADQLAQVLVWSAVYSFITAPATYDDADDAETRLIPGVAHIWALGIYGRPLQAPTES